MHISVIPLEKSIGRDPLIYSVDLALKDAITQGCLVEIPFGKSVVQGIVEKTLDIRELSEDSSIRPIERVIFSCSLVSREGLDLILDIARSYYLPIHKVALMHLPKSLRSWLEKKHSDLPKRKRYESDGPRETKIIHSLSTIITSEILEGYLTPGVVVIFPESIMLSGMVQDLSEKYHALIQSETGEGTETTKKQGWLNVYTGKFPIIFGTRKILYYNLECYHTLIYIEDAFGADHFAYPIRIQNIDLLKCYHSSSSKNISILTSSLSLTMLSRFSGTPITSL